MSESHKKIHLDEEQKRLAEELLFSEKKAPSFVKQLYFGRFDPTHVMPFPYLPQKLEEEAQGLLARVKDFTKQIDPDWIDRHGTIPDRLIHALCEMGVMGMTVPKQYGGLGMSQNAYCRVTETLASKCCSTALFVNVHQSIGLRAVLLFGSEEQRNRWLPSMARGVDLAAFSLTEPNAGSDANGIETQAVFNPERNVYVINGQKQWTTSGGIAKVLTVMAKTEVVTAEGKKNKVTAFLVTSDMPGFQVTEAALEKVGMRGTKTANLRFKNMEVPADSILGPLGGGLKVCLTVLDYGRVTFGASCTGVAKALMAQAVIHAQTRMQFKRPLAQFELVKKKLAYMGALTYAMDATTYLTAGLIDRGIEDIMLEAAILKVFASDALWEIIYDTMQIFGGRSFFTSYPFERIMRDARLNMIGEGSNEVMRAFIGAVGMRDVGVQLKGVVEALKAPFTKGKALFSYLPKAFEQLSGPLVPIQSAHLKSEGRQLGRAIQRFGLCVIRVLARYREEVVEHQLDLDRMTTAAIALYTMTAVLSKLDCDLQCVGNRAEKLGNDLARGKLYCKYALKKFNHSLSDLFSDMDQDINALSDAMVISLDNYR